MKLIRRNTAHDRPVSPSVERSTSLLGDSFWDPFALLPAFWRSSSSDWSMQSLSVDVFETDSEMRIEADVPGYDPKNIQVEINDNMVSIRGTMNEEKEDKGKKYYRKERQWGEFSREFSLPHYVDASKAKCKVKNGTLSIVLPKKKESSKKNVEIEIE